MKNILSVTLFFFILSCSSSKKNTSMNEDAVRFPLADFDKQGHRVCRGLMPENTIPAMINALGLGVTTLEMDVVITKDKQVILSHEPFFNHEITTKADGSFVDEKEEKNLNIFNMTYPETQKYDVGLKPHPRFPQKQKMAVTKPLLSQVFDTIKKWMMTAKRPYPYFNIETKCTPATDNIYHPKPEEFVELIMKEVMAANLEGYVIIQSFDIRTLQYLHKKYPPIKTALLIEENDPSYWYKQVTDLGFHPTIYSPHYSLVSKSLVDHCKNYNTKVIPWTVNDKATIERLKAMGVNGIITDYPNLFNE
jgi:glycerophosphoryl diester phosphodiesterase